MAFDPRYHLKLIATSGDGGAGKLPLLSLGLIDALALAFLSGPLRHFVLAHPGFSGLLVWI